MSNTTLRRIIVTLAASAALILPSAAFSRQAVAPRDSRTKVAGTLVAQPSKAPVLKEDTARAAGIASAADYVEFVRACNAGTSLSRWCGHDTTVVILADLDFAKVKKVPAINAFNGVLDGCGHSIKNLTITGGLIHELQQGAEIQNLTIDASCRFKLSGSAPGDPISFGTIAERSSGLVTGCTNNAPIRFVLNDNCNCFIGGLVGQNLYCLLDCTNNAPVSVACDATVSGSKNCIGVGGLVGGTIDKQLKTTHIARCINNGAISAETAGINVYCGGIAGLSAKSKVKLCVNYGSVNATTGASSTKLKAGGIVGKASDNILACDNFGPVAVSGGKPTNAAGAIAGWANGSLSRSGRVKAIVVDDCREHSSSRLPLLGSQGKQILVFNPSDAEYATPAKKIHGEYNVYGYVKSADGEALADVVVSDGYSSARTDATGLYCLKSDLSQARFIQVSLPSTVRIMTDGGLKPQFYKRIPRFSECVSADFYFQTAPALDHFNILFIADPQVKPWGYDNSMEAWSRFVAPEIGKMRSELEGETYAITLGDNVWNEMQAYEDYLKATSQLGCPVFFTEGNHDFDQTNLFDSHLGNISFETHLGPDHYSFNIGKIHFVVIDDILYYRHNPNELSKDKTPRPYRRGMEESTLRWLESDLAFVPKDTKIMVCSHGPLFGDFRSQRHCGHMDHYNEYMALLRPYKAVIGWAGHVHSNQYYDYARTPSDTYGAPNFQSSTVARATGTLKVNEYYNGNGIPQGCVIMNVDGEDFKWQYRACGKPADVQASIYGPDRTGDGTVKVRPYNWNRYTKIEWYEDGVKVGDLKRERCKDPNTVELSKTRTNIVPQKTELYSITPTPGAKSGEVRITDQAGKVFTYQLTL